MDSHGIWRTWKSANPVSGVHSCLSLTVIAYYIFLCLLAYSQYTLCQYLCKSIHFLATICSLLLRGFNQATYSVLWRTPIMVARLKMITTLGSITSRCSGKWACTRPNPGEGRNRAYNNIRLPYTQNVPGESADTCEVHSNGQQMMLVVLVTN